MLPSPANLATLARPGLSRPRLLAAYGRGDLSDVAEAVEPHLPVRARPGRPVSAVYLKNVRSGLLAYLSWAQAGGRALLDPAPDTGDAYRMHLNAKHRQPGSVKTRLSHARLLYAALLAQGLVAANPFDDLMAPKNVPAEHRRYWSGGNLRRLLAHNPDVADQSLLYLGVHAGLTGRQVAALRWTDVHLEPDGRAGHLILSHDGGRVVDLDHSPELRSALARYRKRQQPGRGDRLFLDLSDDYSVRRRLFVLAKIANSTYQPWRDLRNTAALRLLAQGFDADAVMARMGVDSDRSLRPWLHERQRRGPLADPLLDADGPAVP